MEFVGLAKNLARWCLAFALAGFLVGCGPEPEPAFPKQPYLFPVDAAETGRVDRIVCSVPVDKRRVRLEQAMRDHNVVGVSAAAMFQGRVVWARAWGFADAAKRTPLTPETVMQAASISKAISSVGVLRMAQAGKLSLDRDVSEYIDGWEPRFQGKRVKITLRQLLSHSAGLNVHGFRGFRSTKEDLPSTIDILNGKGNSPKVAVTQPPGTKADYSGGGFTVLQAVVEAQVEDPFDAAMYQWLIKPFRLPRSTFEQPISEEHERWAATAHGNDGRPIRGRYHVYPMQAAAGLWTTPTDLLTLAGALVAAYRGAPGPLSQGLVQQMLTPASATGSIGLGWFLSERGGVVEAYHSGQNAGFTSNMVWRTDGSGAVVMVNGDGPIAAGLVRAIGEEYGWRERSGGGGCAP